MALRKCEQQIDPASARYARQARATKAVQAMFSWLARLRAAIDLIWANAVNNCTSFRLQKVQIRTQ